MLRAGAFGRTSGVWASNRSLWPANTAAPGEAAYGLDDHIAPTATLLIVRPTDTKLCENRADLEE